MLIKPTPVEYAALRLLHARTVRDSVALVRRAATADLDRPTPCERWTLRELLAHMTAQHVGFAAAGLAAAGVGEPGDPTVWAVQPLAEDFAARYEAAAEQVIDAFAQVTEPERTVVLPEFTREQRFPASLALGFHLLDYAVHGWDVARALGFDYAPAAEVATVILPIARAVPDGAERLAPDSSFAPGLDTAEETDTWSRILLLLGRSPAWQPATTESAPC